MIEEIFPDSSGILVIDSNIDESKINMIINQTNYSKDEAKKKLLELGDPILVIKEYINPNNNKNFSYNEESNKSINQLIYKEIRDLFYTQKINSIKY